VGAAGGRAAATLKRLQSFDNRPGTRRGPARPPAYHRRMFFTDHSRGFDCAEDPEVVRFGGRYFMYYVLAPGDGVKRQPWNIGIAVSTDFERFEKVAELGANDLGQQNGVAVGSVLVHRGKIHMFYFSYGTGAHDSVCLATSDDGLWFTPHPANPIFRATGEWNCGRAVSPHVVRVGDRWRMYACTRDPEMTRQSMVLAEAPVASDLGPGAWQQLGSGEMFGPELPWEHESTESPSLIEHDGHWYMFYGGGYWTRPQQIGCAMSVDGVRWMRLDPEPLLPYHSGANGTPLERASPSVFRDDDGSVHLFVQESADRGRNWRVVRFPVRWEGGRPVIDAGQGATPPV
jgi:hypothetical protein